MDLKKARFTISGEDADPPPDRKPSPPPLELNTDDEDTNMEDEKLLSNSPSANNNHQDGKGHYQNNLNSSGVDKVRFIIAGHESEKEVDSEALQKHTLFCQMDVLCHFDDGEMGWKETARWLKYEEKVEEGDRWSKPHVATTSLHALFEIRKGLVGNQTVVILDMKPAHESKDVPGQKKRPKWDAGTATDNGRIVFEQIRAHIVEDMGWPEDTCDQILDALLKPHKHKHRKVHAVKEDKQHLHPLHASKDKPSTASLQNALTMYPHGSTASGLADYTPNKKMMKKIPGGSEAANIMIGQVDFLEEPLMVLARLNTPAILSDLSEVALPTRFLFICLGPPEPTSIWQIEEVGRSMASLFTDTVFSEVAYKADSRQDIIDGIDEFMDDLTVLPPSVWDPQTRLEPPETTMSIDQITKRLDSHERHEGPAAAFEMEEIHVEDNTLKRTGRIFGGMIQDIKRRYPMYWSDIKDGISMQGLAAVIFLYFACITPIITFGGMMGYGTDGYMGTMESILSGAICGLTYHAFSGQPLTIVGATGPLLVFETLLYSFSMDNGFDFMGFRFWVGMWITLILLVFVIFDLSSLVAYITRFTEESFSVLISLIFIAEAFKKVIGTLKTHPMHYRANKEDIDYKCHCLAPPNTTFANSSLYTTEESVPTTPFDVNVTDMGKDVMYEFYNWTTILHENCITYMNKIIVDHDCITEHECEDAGWELVGDACNVKHVTHAVPDVFFFAILLFLGTFGVAVFLANLRNGLFFPSIVRTTLADFAVLISIVMMTAIDFGMGIDTPKLFVPAEFRTTRPGRGWIINPLAIGPKYWLIAAALVPAAIATILIFLDQQITAVIVNRKEHKLKKGPGYHLDLFVLAVIVAVCSVLGLPWFVAATVRSLTHVHALFKQSEIKVPGERPQMLGVREQRLTGICIHLLIGVSILLTVVLKHVPMAVLYGVFLYMGVRSLSGVQFVQRISILFMPAKYQPDYVYLRHVETRRIHLFTAMQILGMVTMWVVKSIKMISLLFPIMILLLCFVRKAMDWIFTRSELFWLDHLLPEEHRREKEDKIKDIDVEDGMYKSKKA